MLQYCYITLSVTKHYICKVTNGLIFKIYEELVEPDINQQTIQF